MSSRERIDEVALQLLARHGYDGMSLQALADEVGLHKSTLFHHYRGKAELASHVVERVMGKMLDRIEPRLSREPPTLDDFVELSEDLVDYLASEPDAARLLLRILLSPPRSPLNAGLERSDHPLNRLLSTLVEWFDRARRAGVVRWVRIRHTLFDLMGVLLFHPAAAAQMTYLAGPAPFSDVERDKRKREVAAFVRGALSPTERGG